MRHTANKKKKVRVRLLSYLAMHPEVFSTYGLLGRQTTDHTLSTYVHVPVLFLLIHAIDP